MQYILFVQKFRSFGGRMNKSRICASMIIALLSLAFLCGCRNMTGAPSDSLDYQRLPAKLEISGDISGIPFSAVLELSAWDGVSGREMSLTYTDPEALRGVTVTCEGGVWGAKLDGVTVTGNSAARLGLPGRLFSLVGNITFIGTENLPGGKNTKATVLSVAVPADPAGIDGEYVARVTVSHDGGRETPVSVSAALPDGRVVTVGVSSFCELPENDGNDTSLRE